MPGCIALPPRAGKSPSVAILATRRQGKLIAAKTADLDPYGTAFVEAPNGQSILTGVGKFGAEQLMEVATANPGLAGFRRRMRQTQGWLLVVTADGAVSPGQGRVYGLSECHQPPSPW